MKNINYYKIEKLKYKHSKSNLLYLSAIFISLFLINAHIFKTKDTISNPDIMIFSSLHSLLYIQLFLLPLLIAILTIKSVELEEQGNMIKVIISSGIDLSKIYKAKLFYLLKKFTAYIIFLWSLLITELSLLGFPCFKMPIKLFSMFISFVFISYLLIIFHYIIAMTKKIHLFNLSLAILGSLLGFISLLFMKFPIIPQSWFALISAIEYVKDIDNHFKLKLVEISPMPAILSTILFVLFYFIGKKLFLRRML